MSDLHEEQLDAPEDGLQQALGEEEADFSIESPKKPPIARGTLALLGLAAAGVGGLYFMYLRGGPQRADASTAAQVRAADQTNHGFLKNSAQGRPMMEQLLHNTQQVVQRFLSYPSATQIPLKDLKANPFRRAPAPLETQQRQISRLEEQRQREAARAALLKSAQSLKLQSVFLGTNVRTCVINNTLCREGQQVGEFTVETITSGGVILKSGQERFELKMGG
jgi:hypothetical protein